MGTVRRFTNFVNMDLPDLKDNEIYVSHVGDGEYNFNVFGSAWDDYMELFNKIAEYFKCKPSELSTGKRPNYDGSITDPSYLVIYKGNAIARITVEQINPTKFPNGYD